MGPTRGLIGSMPFKLARTPQAQVQAVQSEAQCSRALQGQRRQVVWRRRTATHRGVCM